MWFNQLVVLSCVIGFIGAQGGKGTQPYTKNKTYVATSIVSTPYLTLREMDQQKTLTGNARYEGYIVDLLNVIANKLNVKFDIRIVLDGKYGSPDPDTGNWNGMLGELIRKEVDLAAAPLTITATRERVVDFSKPFMHTGIGLVMKKTDAMPPAKPGSFWEIFMPLSFGVWFSLFVALSVVWLASVLTYRFNPEERKSAPTLHEAAFQGTKALFKPDSEIKSCARSVLRVSNCLFWLLIFCLYITRLVWYTQSPPPGAFIRFGSMDDVFKQTELKYGVIQGGSTLAYFKNSRIGLAQRAGAYLRNTPDVLVASQDEGYERVQAGGYAFLTDSPTIQYRLHQLPCDLVKVGDNIDSKGFGIATPLGSPLREHINLVLLELRESGDLEVLHNKWWYEKSQCPDQGLEIKSTSEKQGLPDNVYAVNFGTLHGPLGLLLFGLLLSGAITIIAAMRDKGQKKDEAAAPPLNETRNEELKNSLVEIQA